MKGNKASHNLCCKLVYLIMIKQGLNNCKNGSLDSGNFYVCLRDSELQGCIWAGLLVSEFIL